MKKKISSILSVFFCLGLVAGLKAQDVTILSNKGGSVKVKQSSLPVLSNSPLETRATKAARSAGDITLLTKKPENQTANPDFICSTANWRPKIKSKFDTKATGSLNCGGSVAKPCYWGKPFILVGFINGTPELKELVKEIIAEWTTWANIGFIVDDNSNFVGDKADIKISFGTKGHNSYVGIDSWQAWVRNQGKDYPTMNLALLDTQLRYADGTILPSVKRPILHEFGHALGLVHEHQNPSGGIQWNREAVINYYSGPPNNWDLTTIEHNIFRALSQDRTQFSQYDTSSIMHYSFPAEFTLNKIVVPYNYELSETDKAFIAGVYPRKKATLNTSRYYKLTTWYNNRQNCLGLGTQQTSGGTAYVPYFIACDNSNSGQLWKFTRMSNGDYRITNYFTGDGLALNDFGLEYYTGMAATGNYSNQYWTVTMLENLYRFSSMSNGVQYSLTTNTAPNTQTYMSRTAHWSNQLWELIPAGNVP